MLRPGRGEYSAVSLQPDSGMQNDKGGTGYGHECRKKVQAIDEQMLYLTSYGVTATADILEHMAGQMPGLHRIWTDVSDGRLPVLAAEFPGFRALAIMMEAACWQSRVKLPGHTMTCRCSACTGASFRLRSSTCR